MQALDSEITRATVENALKEDIGEGDITTNSTIPQDMKAIAVLIADEEGILCGLGVAEMVFRRLDPHIEFKPLARDGERVKPGQKLAEVRGNARSLLTGERTALNFLQRLSGTATTTRRFVDTVKPYKAKILDTRKTTPGFREMEKYAVRCGGGQNHRMGLYDMVLIKDNHIRLAGSIRNALKIARKKAGRKKIEVEVESLSQINDALKFRPDIIMLDNMSIADMEKAVRMTRGRILTEASGGVTLSNVEQIARTGVDFISIGSLTHSFKSLPISMEMKAYK